MTLAYRLVFTALAASACSLLSNTALAQCMVTGSTPSNGEIVLCTGNDPDGYIGTANGDDVTVLEGATVDAGGSPNAIDVGGGNNRVTILGGTLTSTEQVVRLTADGTLTVLVSGGTLISDDEVIDGNISLTSATLNATVTGGTLTAAEEVIRGTSFADTILVSGGTLTGGDGPITGDDGNDIITITGGIIQNGVASQFGDEVIAGDDGDDTISVSNATVDSALQPDEDAIDGSQGNDTVVLGDGAVVLGLIEGGEAEAGQATDRLRFTHTVPASELLSLCQAIADAEPVGDSITINGLDYTWSNFEILECELSAAPAESIPTMSLVGLSALALMMLALAAMVPPLRQLKQRT